MLTPSRLALGVDDDAQGLQRTLGGSLGGEMNLEQMLFNGWESVARTVIVGVLAYVALIAFLRVSGKRTLSKMNAFDLVVTVSLGSTLATVLLSRDVALVEGTVAFALLIALQFAVTWTSVRVAWVRNMVSAEPRLLLCQGKPLTANLGQARVTEDELHAAVRAAGLASLADAGAIVLETDGSFSVVLASAWGSRSSLNEPSA